MCPVMPGKMCPMMLGGNLDLILWVGIKVFLMAWIIFVPIVITARLEKIIKLLQEKK